MYKWVETTVARWGIVAASIVIASLLAITPVFTQTAQAAATTKAECEGQGDTWYPSGPDNLGTPYCYGKTTCEERGAGYTWNDTDKTCTYRTPLAPNDIPVVTLQNWGIGKEVKSWLLARGIAQCFDGKSVTLTNIEKADNWSVNSGMYLDSALLDKDKDGKLGCANEKMSDNGSGWIDAARTEWQFGSNREMLCAFGWTAAKRVGTGNRTEYYDHSTNYTTCMESTTVTTFLPPKKTMSNIIDALQKSRGIFATGKMTKAQKYILYLSVFTKESSNLAGCRTNKAVLMSEASDDLKALANAKRYAYSIPIIEGEGEEADIFFYVFTIDTKTSTGRGTNNSGYISTLENRAVAIAPYLSGTVPLATNSPSQTGQNSCLYVAQLLASDVSASNQRGLAQAFLEDVKSGKIKSLDEELAAVGQTVGNDNLTGNGTSCAIDSLGWILCPVMLGIGAAVEGLYGWIESVLVLNPLESTTSPTSNTPTPQYTAWVSMRNIANVLLVISFLIIIFSQLTSVGVSNYGVKKLLPRLVLVAIAINISFFLMQIMIDIVNIIGTSIKPIFESVTPDNVLQFGSTVEKFLTGTLAVGAGVIGLVVSAGGLLPAALIALLFLLGAFLSIIAAVFTMFIRNAAVIILAVIAPVAIAAYLLPNTEKLFGKWRDLFFSMLFLFPMAALLFGGAAFAAGVIANTDPFIAMFIAAAPLGALPFLVRSSNKILGAAGGALQGLAKKGTEAARKSAQPYMDARKAEYQSGQRNLLGRQRRETARRTIGQTMNDGKLNLEKRAGGAKELAASQNENRGRLQQAGAIDTRAGRAAASALRAGDTAGAVKQANSAMADRQIKTRIATGDLQNIGDQIHDAQLEAKRSEGNLNLRQKRRIETNDASSVSVGERLGDIAQQTEATKREEGVADLQIQHNNLTGGDVVQRTRIAEATQEQERLQREVGNEEATIKQAVDTEATVAGSRMGQAEDRRIALQQAKKTDQEQSAENYAERIQTDTGLQAVAGGGAADAAEAAARAALGVPIGPLPAAQQQEVNQLRTKGVTKAKAFGVQTARAADTNAEKAAQVLAGGGSEAAWQAGFRYNTTSGQLEYHDPATGAVETTQPAVEARLKTSGIIRNDPSATWDDFGEAGRSGLREIEQYHGTPFGAASVAKTLASQKKLTAAGLKGLLDNAPFDPVEKEAALTEIRDLAAQSGLTHLGYDSIAGPGGVTMGGVAYAAGEVIPGGGKGGAKGVVEHLINTGAAINKGIFTDPIYQTEAGKQFGTLSGVAVPAPGTASREYDDTARKFRSFEDDALDKMADAIAAQPGQPARAIVLDRIKALRSRGRQIPA